MMHPDQPDMDRYAVIGNPVAHSLSPAIHARFASQTGQTLIYERLLAPADGFAAVVDQLIAAGGRGANVTVPFKTQAFSLATKLTERANAAGAVNTLSFKENQIIGDNTDGAGLIADLTIHAGITLAGKRILLLGAGGASQGVLLPLLQTGPAAIVIANRTESKASAIAQRFQNINQHATDKPVSGAGNLPMVSGCGFAALATVSAFDIVINATAASLAGAVPEVPASIFAPHTLAYDMMYGALPTPFMQFAAHHKAQVRDGLGMLVEQAAESFFVWRGLKVDTAAVLNWLRGSLQ